MVWEARLIDCIQLAVVAYSGASDQPVLRCMNLEEYLVLRTCSQIKEEAAPVLASNIRLAVRDGRFWDLEIDSLLLAASPRVLRFLRQAIPFIREISIYTPYLSTWKISLAPFLKLRELRFCKSDSVWDLLPPRILQIPLLLLGSVNDKLFVTYTERELKRRESKHTTQYSSTWGDTRWQAPAYLTNSAEKQAAENTRMTTSYKILFEDILQMPRSPSP